MSIIPAIAYELRATQNSVNQIADRLSVSHVLPTSPYVDHSTQTTGHAPSNQIFMYHPLLPPMNQYEIMGTTVNGHAIGADWIYTCYAQPLEGIFYMKGAAGLFAIGAQRWATDNNLNNDFDFRYIINITDAANTSLRTRVLKGDEQTILPMKEGDYFWLTYNYDNTTQGAQYANAVIKPESRFMVTRLTYIA